MPCTVVLDATSDPWVFVLMLEKGDILQHRDLAVQFLFQFWLYKKLWCTKQKLS